MKNNDILIAGADDFAAPYIYDAYRRATTDDTDIWMLGTGETAGMKIDLDAGPARLPAAAGTVVYLDATDSGMTRRADDFTTLLTRARNLTATLEQSTPRHIVYISTAAVYGATHGEALTEDTPCEPTDPYGRTKLAVERHLADWCASHGVTLAILRPAMVTGTGMGGYLRAIVNSVWRGTYRHITDNTARVSVIHATDLAQAAVAVTGRDSIRNVTDGDDPTLHDLVEALAWRLDHKRVFSIPHSKARKLARIGDYLPVTGFTSRSLAKQLSTLTYDSTRLRQETGLTPTPVIQYLRQHTYDESSR